MDLARRGDRVFRLYKSRIRKIESKLPMTTVIEIIKNYTYSNFMNAIGLLLTSIRPLAVNVDKGVISVEINVHG